jgi:hypothetical protein
MSVNSVLRYTHEVPGETAIIVDKMQYVQNLCSRLATHTKRLKIQTKIA